MQRTINGLCSYIISKNIFKLFFEFKAIFFFNFKNLRVFFKQNISCFYSKLMKMVFLNFFIKFKDIFKVLKVHEYFLRKIQS